MEFVITLIVTLSSSPTFLQCCCHLHHIKTIYGHYIQQYNLMHQIYINIYLLNKKLYYTYTVYYLTAIPNIYNGLVAKIV